ncbi:lovastatin nonaketide synthase [Aspergillus ibericus CBS 121593]|uniref:Lovastatin nonaketide synthase n=1 Tax=Aspergillus ibericus CBS 121593 TaxID=1448316 RepID=A0A395GIP1_9EURO|nr:lovastatin nonaketide synthase [Aspergillus ibericus CBS 121593]RAK95330.1 lovastatin nonaketide synthase [Aspergillus ibericus CBS 121593]
MAGDLRGRQGSQEPEVSTKESSPGFSPFESGSSVTSIDGPNPAVLVGYACRVAGADRPSKLWDNIVEQKDVRCKMPANRFNVDNFFHPDGTHKGTTNAKYGYYLDQDLGHFDRSFFRISGKEAEAMDPQQRLILEVVYEALEDAGITLEEINGSRTSVLCGSFTNDYNAMLTKDLEYYPSYTVTGTGNAILSNRVSYVFNLQGMSLTIDTACSSSLVAFHLGAQSIQSGDCDTSIIVGSALHFDPNIFITMTDLGMLSEEGRSRAFAAGVKGYARGDGVCAVILRGQRQAELHGDDIRAIVRATGSNHDGTKQGITLPSSDGQEELIRKTYRSAGLDPVDTTYVEAHGTGTGRGDPLETKALGAVFGSKRRKRPLYVGSIKSNIGHTEGASGLAGIIKATMALEKGQIPPNMHFKIPNPEIKFDEWQIEVPTELVDFPLNAHGRRRVSINSFGYGGANAHVVLEDYRPHTIQERPPSTVPPIFEAAVQHRPFLVPLTSHSDKAGDLLTERLVEYLQRQEDCQVADLAVSLSTARSMHDQRSYAIGNDPTTIQQSLQKVPAWTKTSKQAPRLGFVFTGQGAQWYAMGRQLIEQSPIFLQTLQRADQVLKALPDGPKWSVVEELSRTKEDSQLSQTHLSQPICTALQLAILALLKTWGVEPTAVVGHSSGEMGAAFAAGILSFESAMYAAYYRGLHMSNGAAKAGPDAIPGAMMAVGLGESEAAAELEPYKGRAVIAAVNSPSSVTLSGDEDAIIEVQKSLEARKIFARRLQVAQAFHSHHMFPLAPAYAKALNECDGFAPQPSDKARMFSSVTARVADAEQMGAEYWTANMTGTVRFSDALVGILIDDAENQNVDVLVEIGPHAALKGPARQVMKSLNLDLPYFASLTRGTPDYEGILGLAGQLFQVGYPVDLLAVNSDAYLSDSGLACTVPRGQRRKDLPSYPWDHSERYWAETRLIHNHRLREYRHSLLGAKMAGSIENHVRWRNYLRIRELPWLADHVIDGKVLFPAAGYMSLAFEAVARARDGLQATDGFALRNVSIKSALVLDDSDMGTELIVDLHPQVTSAKSRSDTWYEFEIFSYDSRYHCTEHCSGLVAVEALSGTTAAQDREARLQSSTAWSPVSRYYRHLSDIGLQYGDEFRLLNGSIESGPGFACASLTFNPEKYASQPADVTFVHPTILDATFHTIFPALELVLGRDLDEAYIPTFVESCHIYPEMLTIKDAQGPQEVWVDTTTEKSGFRSAISHLSVETAVGHQPLLSFSGLRVTSLGSGDDSKDRSLFFRVRWQAAFDQLSAESSLVSQASLAELLDMFVHQHPNTKILHVTGGVEDTEQVLRALSGPNKERRRLKSLTPVSGNIVASGDAWEQLAGQWPGLVSLEEPAESDYDLVLITGAQQSSLLPFLKEGGHVIAPAQGETETALELLFQSQEAAVWKRATTQPEESSPKPLVIIHSSPPSSRTVDLISRLAASMKHRPTSCVEFNDLAKTPLGDADVVVLASLDGPLFMQRDPAGEAIFDAARELLLRPHLNLVWLLEGATDQVAENPLHAMIVGLARVARTENEGARILTLDLPVDYPPQSTVPFVNQLLDRAIVDEEWSLRDGALYIPRIEADDELNSKVRGGVNSGEKLEAFGSERPIQLTIGQVGRLESLVWEDDEAMLDEELGSEEIEIAVKASTVNARDVAAATGTIDDFRLGDECAGLVLRVGSQVDPAKFQPGDKVLAIRPGQGAHRSVVRNPASCCFRLGPMPFEDAAALPQILVTPYYALVEIARLQAGESVLVHAAASGVGQMAVQIAQMVGANIIATAGSEAERDLLVTRYGLASTTIFSSRDISFVAGVQKATSGRGVDVVLNSLSGKLLHGSWRCVAPFGRFIEIGKQDINENAMLEMAPFQRNVLFASVDLVTLYATNQALGARLFQEVCDLCHVGKLGMPETVLGVPYSEAPKAFRLVQSEGHIGQVVLKATDETQVPIRPPTWNRRANQFSPDKTYLLAGGLGGLGRTLAEWMLQRNAKKLVFLSRSGETREEAKSTVSWLRAHGIQVTVHKGDVAKIADVEACVKAIPNLGGVFHAAMVLADAALENMTYAQWHTCVQPKVVGAYNLHRATKDLPLDFFVAFSSVSGCFGTKSQGNYAAANAYIDALCRHRRQIGLPASTMNCGRITGIGVAAEAASLERFMEQEGFDGVNGQELLQQVEEAVFSDQTATVSSRGVDLYQTVTGVILTRDDVYWAPHSLFKNLYQNHDFDRRSGQKPGEVSLPVLFTQVTDPEQRAALLLERFVEKLAVSLGVPKESPKPADPIYGLDSLLAVDLRNWFTKTLGVDIALFDVMGAPSIRSLIEKAVSLYKDQEVKSGKPAPQKASSASAATGASEGAATLEIPKADLAQPLPLSTFQNRLWFSHSFAQDKSFLNIPVVMHMRGTPDHSILRRTLTELRARNPILRTAYQEGDDFAEQAIIDPTEVLVKFRDVSAQADPREALQTLVATLKRKELDIEVGELIDATLVKVTPENYALVLIMHHICTDRGNTQPLLTQITTLYDTLRNGRSLSAIPAPKVNYADFTLWHNQLLSSDALVPHVEYWRQALAGMPTASPLLPFAKSERPSWDDYSRATITAQLKATQLKRIKRICSQAKSSPFQFLFSAFRAFLYRYTADKDLTILMVDGNRPHAEFNDLLGFFVNMTPIRCQDACEGTFEALLKTMSGRILESMSHSVVPFDVIVSETKVARSAGHFPLGQVMVNYQQPEGQAVYQAGDFALHKLEAENMPSGCELSLEAREDSDNVLQLQLEFSTTLYGEPDMRRFFDNFQTFLTSVIKDHRQPIASVPVCGPAEIERLGVQFWNHQYKPHSWDDTTIVERVLSVAETRPDAIAMTTSEGESISYRDLVFAARRLAFSLQDAGIRHGQYVGILADPGIPLVVTMLGAWFNRCGYLPMDPAMAVGRLSFITDDSQMGLLLFDEASRGLASQVRAQSKSPYGLLSIRDATASCVLADVRPSLRSDPCYMLYTSGSTGIPKGVRLSQSNVHEMLASMQQHFDFSPRDRFLHQISPSFDLSVVELWSSLTAGARLCIATKATRRNPVLLGEYMRQESVTVTYFTPTQFALVLEHNGDAVAACPEYRIALLCGERLPARLAIAFQRLGTPATLYNCWGPTEAVVQTTIHAVQGTVDDQLNIPIGFALGNCRHYIVDECLNPLAPGFIGELCIGGPQVARGYWNRPEVNRKQFIRNPFCSPDDEDRGWTMLFRTGDRARFLPDGQLEFLGRISGDKQVKLRGFRIDLGEVEHVMHRESFTTDGQGIVDLAVVARSVEDDPNSLTDDRQLIAFVVPKKPLQTAAEKKEYALLLQARAKFSLNEYMLPNAYQFLDALPTTTSGKTDRRGLLSCPVELTHPIQGPVSQSSSDPAASQPDANSAPKEARPDTLAAVSRAWQAVLKLDGPPEPTGNFFEMGGQSLLFLRLQGKLKKEFKVALSLQDMIQNPTPKHVAELVDRHLGGSSSPSTGTNTNAPTENTEKMVIRSQEVERVDWVAETTLPMDCRFHPSEANPPAAVTNILLTGADGFTGIHLLANLLTQRPGVTVYVLGSYAPLDHGKIFQKLMEFKLVNGTLTPERILTGIQVVPGFLAHQSHFGLSTVDFKTLATSIHAVYHLLSEVSLLKTYRDLKHINTTSTLTLIELANLGGQGSRIHYLSTWSVPHLQSWEQSHRNLSGIQINEMSPIHFSPPATVDNGYFKTRWATEMLLTRAAARGFPVTIYRSSAISGNTVTGVASSDQDIVRGMVMDMVRHGVVPQAGTASEPFVIDFIPVNYLSEALGHLTLSQDTGRQSGLEVLHITNPQPLPLEQLPQLTRAVRGDNQTGRSVSIAEWLAALEEAAGEDEQLRLETLRDYFLNGHNMFALDSRKATALLAEVKDLVACPPVDAKYLRDLWTGTA